MRAAHIRSRFRQSFTEIARDKLARRTSDLATNLLCDFGELDIIPRINSYYNATMFAVISQENSQVGKWPRFLQGRYFERTLFLFLDLVDPAESYTANVRIRPSFQSVPLCLFSLPFTPRISRRRCALEIFLRRFSHRRDANSRGNKGLEFHEGSHIYT